MKFIKTEIEEYRGTIVLNNDSKHNSLNIEMLDEIAETLNNFNKEKLRAVVIRSNPGVPVWCAGLRIDQLPDPAKDPVPYEYPLEKVLRTIEEFPGAVIAMIEGSVWGGGCELAFACDILIGSPKSTFAITPAKLGAPYNPMQVQRVLNLVETNIARELFFTASPIKAERALELGILNHIIEAQKLEEFTFSMCEKIAANAPLNIVLLKKEINVLSRINVKEAATDEIKQLIKESYYSEDFSEGRKAFLEKRLPVFKGK
jgi:methylmalonyl-CoA decarboxylase